MSRHVDKVLANAERELGTAEANRPAEILPLYKRFLKIEEHRLRLKHQAGGGGREVARRRAELVDILLKHVFESAAIFAWNKKGAEPTSLTLIALGGYGRGALNPFSDVDVLFLHDRPAREISPYVQLVVEQVLYLLWDIGFKVGHSTQSIDDAIVQANSDVRTKTAMLESRDLAGDPEQWERFRNEFRARCVEGHEEEYIASRLKDQAERHSKFGDSVYLQEPNVKSGCGGLRDYQNLLWTAYFNRGAVAFPWRVSQDWWNEGERNRVEAAYDFLLRLRTDLHYVSRRQTDILYLNLQEHIAGRLGYGQKRAVLRSEALMKDYYEHTRNIFRMCERMTEQISNRGSTGALAAPIREEKLEQFIVRDNQLSAAESDCFEKDPPAMMRAFQLIQERQISLSSELAESISRNLGLVSRTYCYAKKPREIFESIMSRKGEVGRILRAMHRVDFLGRYIPEFEPLTCLVQHEFFHRYTADEHTLVCIEKLDEILQTENPKFAGYRALFEKLEDPFVLYLAILLHDTGRGVGARPHSEASAVFAQRVAARFQLSSERRRSLIRLVDHHVTLSSMAQQRNVDDPETAVEFARIVADQKNLDALMLLTFADGRGTSAEAWSDWKEALVWQLYRATSQYLTDQKGFFEQRKIERESLQGSVLGKLSKDFADELEAHFEFMPDNYFRAFDVEEIGAHAKLFRRLLEKFYLSETSALAPAISWASSNDVSHSTVSLCTWDHDQLLARIAGAFAALPLNILSADIYTRGDNIVLDIFRVADLKNHSVTDLKEQVRFKNILLESLLKPDFDFGPLLDLARRKIPRRTGREMEFPTSVSIENKAHQIYTLVQIQTPDRLGLLYDLLSAFSAERISIALSRISTEKGAAVDTFYVADRGTRNKILDSARIASLQVSLQLAAVGKRAP